jgi:pSer/pThr/pTyr-binding forkhead associated (FHA) protein
MAADSRQFDNIDIQLPDGETIRFGTHKAKDGTVDLKLRLPGGWDLVWLGRGRYNAKQTTLTIKRDP